VNNLSQWVSYKLLLSNYQYFSQLEKYEYQTCDLSEMYRIQKKIWETKNIWQFIWWDSVVKENIPTNIGMKIILFCISANSIKAPYRSYYRWNVTRKSKNLKSFKTFKMMIFWIWSGWIWLFIVVCPVKFASIFERPTSLIVIY